MLNNIKGIKGVKPNCAEQHINIDHTAPSISVAVLVSTIFFKLAVWTVFRQLFSFSSLFTTFCNLHPTTAVITKRARGYLAVANRWVAAGISSQDAAQSRAAGAIHDWVAGKGAVQVFLYLQIPVVTGGVPPNCNLAAHIA